MRRDRDPLPNEPRGSPLRRLPAEVYFLPPQARKVAEFLARLADEEGRLVLPPFHALRRGSRLGQDGLTRGFRQLVDAGLLGLTRRREGGVIVIECEIGLRDPGWAGSTGRALACAPRAECFR